MPRTYGWKKTSPYDSSPLTHTHAHTQKTIASVYMTILWQENLSQKTEGHLQLNSPENKLLESSEYGLGKTLKIPYD